MLPRTMTSLLVGIALLSGSVSCNNGVTNPEAGLTDDIQISVVDVDGKPLKNVAVHPVFRFDGQLLPQQKSSKTGMSTADAQLYQNYPNPFSSMTVIRFAVPNKCKVKFQVTNLDGDIVVSLIDCWQESGYYSVNWNGKNQQDQVMGNGLYLFRLSIGDTILTRTGCLDEISPDGLEAKNANPLVLTDANGIAQLAFSDIPFGERVLQTTEEGPEIVQPLDISQIDLVFIRPGYESVTKTLSNDFSQKQILNVKMSRLNK